MCVCVCVRSFYEPIVLAVLLLREFQEVDESNEHAAPCESVRYCVFVCVCVCLEGGGGGGVLIMRV